MGISTAFFWIILHGLPNLFWGDWDVIHLYTKRIKNGIANCRCYSIHWNLSHGFHAKWMRRLKRFNKNGLQLRHFMSLENVIITQIVFARLSFIIVNHLFTDCITKRLGHAPFNLS